MPVRFVDSPPCSLAGNQRPQCSFTQLPAGAKHGLATRTMIPAGILVWDLPGQHWCATGSLRASASGGLTSSKKPGVQTSVVMPSGHDGVLGRCSGLSVMSRYCTPTQRGRQHLLLRWAWRCQVHSTVTLKVPLAEAITYWRHNATEPMAACPCAEKQMAS